jgi:hypothetical protein
MQDCGSNSMRLAGQSFALRWKRNPNNSEEQPNHLHGQLHLEILQKFFP